MPKFLENTSTGNGWFLNLLRQEKEERTTFFVLVLLSIVSSQLLITTDGNLFEPIAIIVIVSVVLITFYRLDWGLMLFIGMVLALDQFAPKGFARSIIGVEYFRNLKTLSYFSGIDLAVVNPLELHLLLLLFVWLILIAMGKRVILNRVPVWPAALIFFLWLSISAIYGIETGGEFLPALWELRALFYMGLMYFLVPQIIQTKDQLEKLVWVCIVAISFKAFQGTVRYIRLGFDLGGRDELTSHEDPLFFISLFILLFGLTLFGSNVKQRKVLTWLMVPLLFVFLLAQRRATYAALGIALIAFMVILHKKERRKMFKMILPAGIIVTAYLIAFWNSTSSFGLTAQLIKSSFLSNTDKDIVRYYSTLYREMENYNLAQTVKKSPIIGIGFGNKYEQPIELPRIRFPLRDYIPHNEILWLQVKMGGVGFFFFWIFINSFVYQASSTFSRLKDPYLQAVCAVSIIAIVGQIVVSFFDLQLTFYRNMIYLGSLMGLLPTIDMIDKNIKVLVSLER
ncbi:MAG: O-antigen ligase family protein [Ignavibacteriae bacterium]|nr:O-antigen ligase family protein [Ignavibacteriota bacterium]